MGLQLEDNGYNYKYKWKVWSGGRGQFHRPHSYTEDFSQAGSFTRNIHTTDLQLFQNLSCSERLISSAEVEDVLSESGGDKSPRLDVLSYELYTLGTCLHASIPTGSKMRRFPSVSRGIVTLLRKNPNKGVQSKFSAYHSEQRTVEILGQLLTNLCHP